MNLEEVLKVPDQARDVNWENKFFSTLADSQLSLLSMDPQNGPDNWPYIMASTDGAQNEPAQKLIHWLSTRGIGLVINPQKDYPDYVFTYGMIWNFKETGFFYRNDIPQKTGKVNLGQIVHAGTPTPQYLPTYVRNILKEFFRDQGILFPKINLLSDDRVHYDLAFSLESLGSPVESEHEGILEAISWFLPPHYSLILVSEKGLPEFSLL
jgi:hypothetical protein